MQTIRYRLAGAIASAALLAAAAGARAQDAPGQMAPMGPDMAHGQWEQHRQDGAAAHARALHDILNVKPDQEAAFQAFVDSMPGMHSHMGWHDGGDDHAAGPVSTPERLEAMEARMEKGLAEFRAHIAAVKHFYAVLSPDQQRAFDALVSLKELEDARGGMEGFGHHPPMGGPHP